MAVNVMGNQYKEEQFEAKLRKYNACPSNVIQAASKVDSTQDVFRCVSTIAWCQSTRTRASNIARNTTANPRKGSTASHSTKTTSINVVGNQNKKGCQSTKTTAINVAGKSSRAGQRNPRKQSMGSQSTETTATNVAGD